MTPRVRRLALTAHVLSSVGWLGAVAAYLALAIAGLETDDARLASATYLSMDLVGRFVIVPSCLAALVTGIVQSLGTEWGLFRHYWVVAKLGLTCVATAVLLVHLPTVTAMAATAAGETFTGAGFGPTRAQLVVHAAGGLVVLVTTTTLSIWRPWGRTPYGRRASAAAAPSIERASVSASATIAAVVQSVPWRRYVVMALVALALLFVVLHLAGGGMHHH
jgi:hypothetical protein